MTEWEWHILPFWKAKRLDNGEMSERGAHLMRRKIAGEWQYRAMTDEEKATLQDALAW